MAEATRVEARRELPWQVRAVLVLALIYLFLIEDGSIDIDDD